MSGRSIPDLFAEHHRLVHDLDAERRRHRSRHIKVILTRSIGAIPLPMSGVNCLDLAREVWLYDTERFRRAYILWVGRAPAWRYDPAEQRRRRLYGKP